MKRTRYPYFLLFAISLGCFDVDTQLPADTDTSTSASTGVPTATTGTDPLDGTTMETESAAGTTQDPDTTSETSSECIPGVFDQSLFDQACFQ